MFKKFVILLLLISFNSFGQINHAIFFMDRIPQSQQLNPALQPACNFFLGIPGISSIYFDIGNSSLSVNKVFQYNSTIDSVISFLHPLANRNIFFNALKTKNNVFFNFYQDIFSLGFRIDTWYYTINIGVKNNTYFNYPKDFMNLFLIGSPVNSSFDLKYLGVHSNTYAEIAFGLSNNFDETLTLGTKLKLLSGVFNVTTRNNDLSFRTYENADGLFINEINSDASFLMAVPFFKETQNTTKLTFDSLFQLIDDPAKAIKPFKNLGIGIDFGVVYSGIENLKLSVSIVDLGFISWRDKAKKIKMQSNISFSGVEIKRDSIDKAFENIFSAYKDSIQFSQAASSYITAIPTTLYLGAEYFLETYFSFGLMSASQIYLKNWYQQFTLSANFRPLRAMMTTVSYSFLNNGLNYMGIGLTFRPLPPLQFYIISDFIPIHYGNHYIPIYAKSFNLHFGLNFAIGFYQKKKLKDKPLSWE